jgi:hypothetical protein
VNHSVLMSLGRLGQPSAERRLSSLLVPVRSAPLGYLQ